MVFPHLLHRFFFGNSARLEVFAAFLPSSVLSLSPITARNARAVLQASTSRLLARAFRFIGFISFRFSSNFA
jgi:hypothetical protein